MKNASDGEALGAREPMNRERIVRAAAALADEQGVGAVTMRVIGRRLGLEAASLYNHVSGKADLLGGMADLAISEIEPPRASLAWNESLRAWAASARAALARHPWAAALIDARDRTSPAMLAYVDGVLGTLLGAGFDAAEAACAVLSLDAFIHGFERAEATRKSGIKAAGGGTADAQRILSSLRGAEFESAARVAGEFAQRPFDIDAAFHFGLDLILDGLVRRLKARQAPSPKPGKGAVQ